MNGAMIAAWCFQCGLDYSSEVAECVECAVPTVEHAPTTMDQLAQDGEDHLAYELHAWNGGARRAVELALHRERLLHAWHGPTLMVRESDEERVDELIDVIDEEMVTSMAGAATADGDRVGFDLGARSEALHTKVADRLAEDEIDFELMENGFLLVDGQHEEAVAALIEEMQAELRSAHTFGPGVEGVEAHVVVEAIFVAADVLRRNPRDIRQQRHLLDNGELAHQLALPFGYEAPMWQSVLDHLTSLAEGIEDDNDDDRIEADARALRNLLLQYV